MFCARLKIPNKWILDDALFEFHPPLNLPRIADLGRRSQGIHEGFDTWYDLVDFLLVAFGLLYILSQREDIKRNGKCVRRNFLAIL